MRVCLAVAPPRTVFAASLGWSAGNAGKAGKTVMEYTNYDQ